MICAGICGIVKERMYIGHMTHSNYPGSHFISYNDFNGKPRPQYCVVYETPIPNEDTEEKTRNKQQTDNLNKDEDARALLHIYSKKKETTDDEP